MKAESFFIGPHDEDMSVEMNISLSDLKYIHGMLVETYNDALSTNSVTQQLEDLVLNIQKVITGKLEKSQNQLTDR